VIFLFLVLIVMLNLLIAIMSDSFEKVMENWVVEVRTTNATKSASRKTVDRVCPDMLRVPGWLLSRRDLSACRRAS
jgi:hypothetical protein